MITKPLWRYLFVEFTNKNQNEPYCPPNGLLMTEHNSIDQRAGYMLCAVVKSVGEACQGKFEAGDLVWLNPMSYFQILAENTMVLVIHEEFVIAHCPKAEAEAKGIYGRSITKDDLSGVTEKARKRKTDLIVADTLPGAEQVDARKILQELAR